MSNFEIQIIKDTFSKCFGLQSCLKSVRTQGDAIVALAGYYKVKVKTERYTALDKATNTKVEQILKVTII